MILHNRQDARVRCKYPPQLQSSKPHVHIVLTTPQIHLLSLKPRTTVPGFLKTLRDHDINPIIQSRPLRWVILPEKLSTVPLLALNNQWHLYLVLPGSTNFPPAVSSQIAASWTVAAGVPSRLLKDFPAKNDGLLNPKTVQKVDLSKKVQRKESSQELELSPELEVWIGELPERARRHPISMFNLLAFNEGMKGEYLKYGKAFAETIGSRHGVSNIFLSYSDW